MARLTSEELALAESPPILSGVLLVVPTLNEEEGLGVVLQQASRLGVTTMIADGGSTDATLEIAQTFGVPVIGVSRGKGLGWRDFLASVPYRDWEYVAMIDGDATYDLAALPRLIATGADMAIGLRQSIDGSAPPFRVLGNWGFSSLVSWCTGHECPDLLSGFRTIRTSCLESIHLAADQFGLETELTIEFVRRRFRVVWVPVEYRRRGGQSKLRPLTDGWDILLTILRTRCRSL